MHKRKPTIYDIAELAGSSASTVSAVLSGQWQKRRIKESTADTIKEIARIHGYKTNLQARGLRQSRSGLVGLIIPDYENRYFSYLAQQFGDNARARNLCPIVGNTLRNAAEEKRIIESLISYNVDFLFIAGADDPDAISQMCHQAGIDHLNLDLPASSGMSIISDNRWGGHMLTSALLDRARLTNGHQNGLAGEELYFIGGVESDHATQQRLLGFQEAISERGLAVDLDHIHLCSYEADEAERTLHGLISALGHVPKLMFVNSISSFEGVLRVLHVQPMTELEDIVVGVFDWDPTARYLHFPVTMMRQNTEAIVDQAFDIFDRIESGTLKVSMEKKWIQVKPELVPAE